MAQKPVESGKRRGKANGSATVATVERAADLLVYFVEASTPDLGVTEIAEGLGLSKAAVHRLLSSLRLRGLIELDEDSRRYALGVGSLRLGLAYLDRIDIRHMAHPELVRLAKSTNETATLSIRSGATRSYVDQVTPNREVIMSVGLGEAFPLHAGASSKVFLAFLTPEQIDTYLDGHPLDALTPNTTTDLGELRVKLKEIGKQGWARSEAERKEGAASVAAPVLDHAGVPIAVVSVCGPVERFANEFEACRELLLTSTAKLSEKMGWTGTTAARAT